VLALRRGSVTCAGVQRGCPRPEGPLSKKKAVIRTSKMLLRNVAPSLRDAP
jgi:hypothetical protein